MKKKKGSSLVLVLLMMAVLMMVGTTALTTVSMNLKSRMEENKRIQSLYGAEAGLDFAHALIEKTYETATKYAEQKAQDSIKGEIINDENLEAIKTKMNQTFKEGFKEFIAVKNAADTNEFYDAIKNSSYIDSIEDKNKRISVDFSSNTEKIPEFKLIGSSEPVDEQYVFDLYSKFRSVENGINNEREVKVSYVIDIPDYQGRYVSNTFDLNSLYHNRPLIVDQDLTIEGTKLNIKGDILVGGKDYDRIDPVYDKYRGGVKISHSTVKLNSNLYTRGTLNLENQSNVQIDNNLYAVNLYVGNQSGSYSENSHLKVNQSAILDNDLALKSKNSSVIVKDYYGLNDRTYTEGNVTRTSSSIIVNGNENTSLKIEDSAHIMGVAYINTVGEKYQTGESIAVKGNYVAYTQPLTDSNYSDVTFKYYEPLYAADQLNNQTLSALQKSEYFKEFYNKDLGVANPGGVELPTNAEGKVQNVYAAGAIVYKNVKDETIVESSTYNQQADATIKEKRSDFSNYVYNMGIESVANPGSKVMYESLGENAKTLQSVIAFNKIQENCSREGMICNREAIKVIPSHPNRKTLVLGSNSFNYKEDKYIKFDENPSNVKAVILIDGDVIIDGNLDFTGTMMVTGDVIIKGGGVVNLVYDPLTVSDILSQNPDVLPNTFIDAKGETYYVNMFEPYNAGQYNPENYIKTRSWKIIN